MADDLSTLVAQIGKMDGKLEMLIGICRTSADQVAAQGKQINDQGIELNTLSGDVARLKKESDKHEKKFDTVFRRVRWIETRVYAVAIAAGMVGVAITYWQKLFGKG